MVAALTTSDNPFNPITQFDEWYSYDTQHGYNTCGYLSRLARTSEALSDDENDYAINYTIDEIVKMDLMGMRTDNKVHYVKVEE